MDQRFERQPLGIGEMRDPVCRTVNRRSFLKAGTTGMAGLTLPTAIAREASGSAVAATDEIRNCITIFLVGSPGHLDTWDLKPEAPVEFRGPFRPIDTNVPGMQICEHFPLMARMMDKVALIRSLHHTTGAAHENGQRWMMTGCDFSADDVRPHCGSVISRVFGHRGTLPASVILPGKIGNTGAGPLHGQSAGYLGNDYEPFFLGSDPSRAFDLSQETPELRDRYGRNTLGQGCLMARRLVERGCRHVTVNHFDTVFNIPCWDMHADGGELNSTFADYERLLCPQFDRAFTALIEDLEQSGLLSDTVVCVLSEMGRTPQLNPRGGRDHHTTAWTNFLAGGPIRGGQVIGSTDKLGMWPEHDPIEPPQLLASIYHALGIDLNQIRMPGPDGSPVRLVDAEPIPQLF